MAASYLELDAWMPSNSLRLMFACGSASQARGAFFDVPEHHSTVERPKLSLHEREKASDHVLQLLIVCHLNTPGWVSVMVKAIRVIGQLTEFVNVMLIQDLIGSAVSLLARITEVT
jgi:hypothetical protein